MPELPEVETVMRGLKQSITGVSIEEIVQRRAGLRVAFPDNLMEVLGGATLKAFSRRAKYLLVELGGEHAKGQVLIAHLGMSGTFQLKNGYEENFRKHDHLVMYLSNKQTLLYHDPRRFGVITLCDKKMLKGHALLKDLGVEPLEGEFNTAYLKNTISGKSAPIKNTIMDQHVVVGVGNIYAAEALFLSGIHPAKPANALSFKQCQLLVDSIKKVLSSAIESGGSTLRDYTQSSGDSGYFQHHFNVYDRAGEPCYTCKKPIEVMRQAGRSTFFCKKCQKT